MADLFPPTADDNLLPADGIVNYHGPIIPAAEADRFFDKLLNDIPWKHDESVIFGKRIVTARKVAWFGDSTFSYTYSGSTKRAISWTNELRQLKSTVEQLAGQRYNSCLLNLYENGGQGMAWHCDDEKSLGRNTSIASLSFGAERRFLFKHKTTKEKVEITLDHGSLLVMQGTTQTYWLHSIPKALKITEPRINLTFRTIIDQA